jgi:hypothetical protein
MHEINTGHCLFPLPIVCYTTDDIVLSCKCLVVLVVEVGVWRGMEAEGVEDVLRGLAVRGLVRGDGDAIPTTTVILTMPLSRHHIS